MKLATPVFTALFLATSPLLFSGTSPVIQRVPAQADIHSTDATVPAPRSGGILGKSRAFGYSVFSCDREHVQIVHCRSASGTPEEIRNQCAGPRTLIPKAGFKEYLRLKFHQYQLWGIGKLDQDLPNELTEEEVKSFFRSVPAHDYRSRVKYAEEKRDLQARLRYCEKRLESPYDSYAEAAHCVDNLKFRLRRLMLAQATQEKLERLLSHSLDSICAKPTPISNVLRFAFDQYNACYGEEHCNSKLSLFTYEVDGTYTLRGSTYLYPSRRAPRTVGVGAVVRRTLSANGGEWEEHTIDRSSGIPNTSRIWAPRLEIAMNWQQAKVACAQKTDLGLKWSLPTRKDFEDDAFRPQNARPSTSLARLLKANPSFDVTRYLWITQSLLARELPVEAPGDDSPLPHSRFLRYWVSDEELSNTGKRIVSHCGPIERDCKPAMPKELQYAICISEPVE